MYGNSRGVCPILNRAAVILKTQYVLNVSCEWLIVPLTFNDTGLCVPSTEVFLNFGFFISSHRERTEALKDLQIPIIII